MSLISVQICFGLHRVFKERWNACVYQSAVKAGQSQISSDLSESCMFTCYNRSPDLIYFITWSHKSVIMRTQVEFLFFCFVC